MSEYFWIIFFAMISPWVIYEMGIFRKKNAKPANPTTMVAILLCITIVFAIAVYHFMGSEKGIEFVTAYVVELSLSIDNVFCFIMIFDYFKIPPKHQHRVLFWGVVSAMIFRLIMIKAGLYIINQFEWILYVFGVFLIFTGIKICFSDGDDSIADSKILLFCKKHFSITDKIHGEKFFIKKSGKWFATPMVLVLLMIEIFDVVFALDSIPAVLAISSDPFIVFTSNVFAILGLRSLYFIIAKIVNKFAYFKYGIAVILSYVGVKIIISKLFDLHIHPALSLSVIFSIFATCIVTSLKSKKA